MPIPDTTDLLAPETWLLPAIHPVYARLICAELRSRGFSEEQAVAGTRLDWAVLHGDNRFLSYEQLRRLSVHALALSGCPWLGLLVGRRSQLSLHGAVGQAVAAAGSVGEAIAITQRFLAMRQRIVGLVVTPAPAMHMEAVVHLMAAEVREFLLNYLIAAMLRLLEAVTGGDTRDDIRIEWPFPEPAWAAEYDCLPARNSFGHSALRVFLTPALLQRPSLAADPEAMRLALRECERQLSVQQEGGSVTQRVQRRLASCQGEYPSLEQLAEQEHMSMRTLMRRLGDEGTNYQQLLDTVREELACWLLIQTPMPVEDIAARVGYGDTSNFSRTFRRWVGMTPREFRAMVVV
jgi:AraC-like DNA-binding protein